MIYLEEDKPIVIGVNDDIGISYMSNLLHGFQQQLHFHNN